MRTRMKRRRSVSLLHGTSPISISSPRVRRRVPGHARESDTGSSIHDSEDMSPRKQLRTTRAAPAREKEPSVAQRTGFDVASDSVEREAAMVMVDLATELVAVEELRRPCYSRTGVLESVQMVNFMSHENFKVDLGPNVNIVSGPNGSGKSAIVAALQLGLGTKTKDRGATLDAHVRHGQKEAKIVIRILNYPPEFHGDVTDQYKPDLFGNVIIVERRIAGPASGQSSSRRSDYALKDVHGKFVELPPQVTALHELSCILDHFNIMVDNPAALLTQNHCKQFLVQGKPKDMHSLFMRAAMFKVWDDYLSGSESLGDRLDNLVLLKSEGVEESRNHARSLEDRLAGMRDVSKIKAELSELRCRYAWKCVEDLEKEAKENARRCGELSKRIDHEKGRLCDIEAEIEAVSGEVTESQVLSEGLRDGITTAKEEDKNFEDERRRILRDMRRLQSDKKQVNSERESLTARLQRLRTSMQQAESEYRKRRPSSSRACTSLSDMEKSLRELDEKIQGLEASSMQESASADELETNLNEKTLANQRIQEELRAAQTDLIALQRSARDNLRRWGPEVDAARAKIERFIKSFHYRPIGPLGAYIRPRDPKWAKAIHCCLGSSLIRSFVVLDSHDEHLLRDICNNQVSIVRASRDEAKYAVTKSGHPKLICLLDVVDISSPTVYNAIIDQVDADRQMLVEVASDLEKCAYGRSSGNLAFWTPNGDKAFCKYGSRVFIAGPRYVTPLLATELRDDRREKEASVRELERSLSDGSRGRGELVGRLAAAKKKVAALDEQLANSRAERNRVQSRFREAEILASDMSNEFDRTPWTVEIEELEREDECCATDLDRLSLSISSAKTALEEASVKHRKAVQRRPDMVSQREELNEKIRSYWNQLKSSGVEKAHCESRIRSLEREVDIARTDEDKKQRDVDRHTKDASCLGDRPRTIAESLQEIESAIYDQRSRLDNEKRRNRGVSREELENQLLGCKAKMLEADQNLDVARENADLIVDGYHERRRRFQHVLKDAKRSANLQFGKYLSKRGNTGELCFDSKEETLELRVRMGSRNETSRRQTAELGTLSGGERSYATLSFLMAMGESMEIPFRVMDEFDVFMDAANRAAALEMLIAMATEVSHRQFIFLTPLEVPRMEHADTEAIRVFQLSAPERMDTAQ